MRFLFRGGPNLIGVSMVRGAHVTAQAPTHTGPCRLGGSTVRPKSVGCLYLRASPLQLWRLDRHTAAPKRAAIRGQGGMRLLGLGDL